MRSLEIKLVFFTVLMLSSAIISAEEVSTTEESLNAEDGSVSAGIHPRQDANAGSGAAAAANFLQGAGQRIASGATNLIKGVENFVVGVLGAIDNRQLANQIDEAFKSTATTSEDDATTPDSDEEDTTTVPTTTRRTTRKRRATTTTTTIRTTRRYRTRPPTTQRATEFSDPEIGETTARSVDDTPSKVKSPAAPAQQQPIYQQPQIQPIYILPNYQPYPNLIPGLQQAVQPAISGVRTQEGAGSFIGAQQPIYQQVAQPVQGAQPLYQTQQVNPAPGIPGQLVGNSAANAVPVSNIVQQNQLQTSQINQAALNQASPINVAPSIQAVPIQSAQVDQSVPQSSPVLAPVPASIQVPQQNPVPVVVPQQIAIPGSQLSFPQNFQVQQILQALNSITQEPVTVPTPPPPPTKPPSKLAQYSINRKQATRLRPTTTLPPKQNLLGTVRLPNEPDVDPTKLFIAPNGVIRPDIPFTPVRLPPQSGRQPLPPPPPPPSPEEASSSQPGEEGGSTAEPDETATEEPEELENTDTDNTDNSDNARK